MEYPFITFFIQIEINLISVNNKKDTLLLGLIFKIKLKTRALKAQISAKAYNNK